MLAEIHTPKPELQKRLSRFVRSLRRKFPEWVRSDPSGFRGCVLGTMKAILPRERAGRKSNALVLQAHTLYVKKKRSSRGVSWHRIARTVMPGYREAPPAIQKAMRLQLRAKIHSYRHSLKQRERLLQLKKQ